MSRGPVPRRADPTDHDWPEFAPSWAASAMFASFGDGHLDIVFLRCWSVPSQLRDVEDFEIIRVEQTATLRAGSENPVFSEPAIVVGPDGIWSDRRRGTARMLREIADVMDPAMGGQP